MTIQVADCGESFAIIKRIFKHKSNDGYYYPFIYVDWFEDTYKKYNRLNCSIFTLCHNDSYCKIFPLTVVDGIRREHFVHNCNLRCKNSHYLENNLYLKNIFFFKAI